MATPELNGQFRWIVIGVVLALGGAFTGAYNFFSAQFASRAEVQLIREEQQRRTMPVYALPGRITDLERKLDQLSSDVIALQTGMVELQTLMREQTREIQRRVIVPAPRRAAERPPPPDPFVHPTWPASGAPAHQ